MARKVIRSNIPNKRGVIRITCIIQIILFVIALISAITSFEITARGKAFNKNALEVGAVVIDVSTETTTDDDGDKHTTYWSHYAYIVEGKTYTSKSSGREHHIGDEALVYYDPAKPSHAQDHLEFIFPPIAPVVLGLIEVIWVLRCLFTGFYFGNFDLIYDPNMGGD
ncbi:hypothetical protein FACS1894188_01740 [Clostridia bacterium]|nr:hypothetical protein FACS1894188_01740 [Clostridia bacterium]